MTEIFARVADDPSQAIIPVVDRLGQPIGVLRERTLRNHVYSAYGKELIANRSLGRTLRSFLERCPIAELNTPLDRLLAIYSTDENADGILVTDQNLYRGFLSARSIIRAMHEKTLARARDENPLTKLPGNDMINDYLAGLLGRREPGVLAYIDFDNFKPFNDTYGFRQGDRAILLFAELMRKAARPATWFLGHIGGDDFFIGLTETSLEDARVAIGALISKFTSDAESFYDGPTRQRGYITAQDRDGQQRSFPLLSASAVLLDVAEDCVSCTVDDVSLAIATHKKAAKTSPARMVAAPLCVPAAQPELPGVAAM
jgi:GGDEF domain-containing protein